jgi:hypothetical protein
VLYDQVKAMLLNEFLKEHQTVQELKSAAVKQEAMIASQQKQIERLTAGLQRVKAQLELNKPAPQTVLNDFRFAWQRRSHDSVRRRESKAVIVIETHESAGDFKER